MAGFCKNDILLEDQDLLVVRKHAGMAVQSSGWSVMDLEHALLNYLSEKGAAGNKIPYLAVIHRLDQPVEGILVFGKNRKSAADLNRQLTAGNIEKRYLAVCTGTGEKKKGVLIDYLKKDGKRNFSSVVPEGTKDARRAELTYQVLASREDLSLIEIHLVTGRHHQIRVQMAHAGMPLLGDAKYGTGGKEALALCAWKLSFCHPSSGKRLCFSILPEGEEFRQFLDHNIMS